MNQSCPARPRRFVAAALLALGTAAALYPATSPQAMAQLEFAPGTETASNLLPPPREVERLLETADESAERGAYSEATKALGLVLGIEPESKRLEGGGQDFFLTADPESGQAGAPTSVYQAALQRFDRMPDEADATIEVRYGVQARQQLEQAVETGDWDAVATVAGRYPMTAAGRSAGWLAAQHELALGDAAEAARRWQAMLATRKGRSEFGAALAEATASAWLAAGQPRQAAAALERVAEYFPGVRITIGSVELDPSAATATRLASIDLQGLQRPSRAPAETRYLGGGPGRNADSRGGLPLPFVAWHTLMHESVQHEEEALQTVRLQAKSDDSVSLIPSRSALVVPPYLVVMTYDQRLHAVELQTGRLAWATAFSGVPSHSVDPYVRNDRQQLKLPIHDYLAERIWGQQATGQLSSDGKRVFTVVQQPSVDAAQSLFRGAGANIVTRQLPQRHNVLQAYSLAADGSLVWEVGGSDGMAEPRLAGVLFLGPPLPLQGELLALGELNGEVSLFAIGPDDGRLLWRQQLSTNDSFTISDDSSRRNFACCPSVQAGVIVCPTLSGQVVAVDRLTHRLLWSAAYPRSAELLNAASPNMFGVMPDIPYRPMRPRSADVAAVIEGDTVVYAPPDGEGVYAFDLTTGVPRWIEEQREVQYVACIHGGAAIYATGKSVVACDAISGQQLWTTDLSEYGTVVGRAVRSGDSLLVPMSDQSVVRVDLNGGELTEATAVEMPLGNLVATETSLYSVGAVTTSCYPVRDAAAARVKEELAGGDASPRALVQQAEVLAGQGDWDAAFDSALRALQKGEDDPSVRWLVAKVTLAALERDFGKFAARMPQLGELLQDGPSRESYLISLTRGFIAHEQYDDALENLTELIEYRLASRTIHTDLEESLELEPGWTVTANRWMAAWLPRLRERAGEEVRSAVDVRLDAAAASVLAAGHKMSLAQELFSQLPGAAEFHLVCGVEQFRAENYADAELSAGLCRELASRDAPQQHSEALSDAADRLAFLIYRDSQRHSTAASIAQRLGLTFERAAELNVSDVLAGVPLRPALTSAAGAPSEVQQTQLSDDLDVDVAPVSTEYSEADLRQLISGEPWPHGSVEMGPAGTAIADVGAHHSSCRIAASVGEALEGWSVRCSPAVGQIEVVDPANRQRYSTPLPGANNYTDPTAILIDSTVLLLRGSEIIAVDTFVEDELPAAEVEFNPVFVEDFVPFTSEGVLWSEHFGRDAGQSRRASARERWDWGAEHPRRGGPTLAAAGRSGLIVATDAYVSCLNHRTGGELWRVTADRLANRAEQSTPGGRRSNGQPWVTVREGKIVLLDPVAQRRTVLDVLDGAVVEVSSLPSDGGDIWAVCNGNYLTGEKTREGTFEFELRNGLTGETLQSLSVETTVRADVLGEDALVVWGPGQPLHFWNLQTGQAKQHEVDCDARIDRLRLQRFGDAIAVVTHSGGMLLEVVESENKDEFLNASGPLLAIDGRDGRPLWPEAVNAYGYYLPIQQPRIAPGILLVRPLTFPVNGSNVSTTSVAMLGLSDGKQYVREDYLASLKGINFRAVVSPAEHTLSMFYHSGRVDFRWTEAAGEAEFQPELGKTNAAGLAAGLPEELRAKAEEMKLRRDSSPFFDP